MTFDLIDRTDIPSRQTPDPDIGFGNALQKIFKQNQSSTQGFLQAPQTSSFIDSQPFDGNSSRFDQPSFTPLDNSDIEPIKTMEFKSFKPESDGFNFLFNQPLQNQQPFSPIQTMEDRFPNNASATPISKAFDGFLKNPNENLSFGQTPQTLLDTTGRLDKDLLNNPGESGLLKNLSFAPGQKNGESLNGLFEKPGSNRERDLEGKADDPEQVAGLWDSAAKIYKGGKSIYDKFLKRAPKSNKPKKEDNQQKPTTQKPRTRTVDPKSKDFFENNSKEEIAKSISQAVDAIAEINGIAKGSEQYNELVKDLRKTWKEEKRHPKYWPITNPNTKTKSFGSISKGKNISPGEIRLPIGHNQIGKVKLRKKHLEEYKKLGFNSVEEYVDYVGKRYGEIYQNTTNGRLVIVRRNGKSSNLVLELSPTGDEVYNVISGFPQETEEFNERVEKGRFKLIGRRRQNGGS
jgi:hypothetical protein